ncbi:MAG TPA: hypothetical protein VFL14_07320 [Xanthomonadales bacterium]|nr:hypothetical protein [Xanthomonadales bacterium]
MASKLAWKLIPRQVYVAEALQWLAGVATLALGWVTLPMLYGLAGVEVLLVMLVSGFVYRLRSVGTIVIDCLKGLVLWAFCALFVIGAYTGAGGFRHGARVEPRGFAILAGLVALRIATTWWRAHGERDPRLAWTREAAMRGAVLALSFFFAAFACFVPGMLLVKPLAHVLPDTAIDVALGACLLATQALLALVTATMTPQELAAIARQPYNERS